MIGLFGCGDAPVPVGVRASLGSGPLTGVTVIALPYDPQRLLDSLAAAYGRPAPAFPVLQAQMRAYHSPARIAGDDQATARWRGIRDTVQALADSLRRVDRRSPGYAAAYHRFRLLYRQLMRRSAERESARRDEIGPVRELAQRAARAADSLRAWERAAYAGFDSAAAGMAAAAGRAPTSARTDTTGWARFALRPGTWWLTLTVPDSANPFLEYRWVIPLYLGRFPVNVPLSAASARSGWRH